MVQTGSRVKTIRHADMGDTCNMHWHHGIILYLISAESEHEYDINSFNGWMDGQTEIDDLTS